MPESSHPNPFRRLLKLGTVKFSCQDDSILAELFRCHVVTARVLGHPTHESTYTFVRVAQHKSEEAFEIVEEMFLNCFKNVSYLCVRNLNQPIYTQI